MLFAVVQKYEYSDMRKLPPFHLESRVDQLASSDFVCNDLDKQETSHVTRGRICCDDYRNESDRPKMPRRLSPTEVRFRMFLLLPPFPIRYRLDGRNP
jgi:hypothetical protein